MRAVTIPPFDIVITIWYNNVKGGETSLKV
nr:MAG TPA: hypothetical protein [Caudoviricetes sp.]